MLPAPRRPGSAAWALTPRTCSCQRRPSDKELGDESGVHHLRPGERVAAFTPGGGMAEVAIAAAAVTVEVPPGVPLGTAASAPLAVSTALLLLTDRARIRPGESGLMQSASGGNGSV